MSHPSVVPALFYREPKKAIEFLRQAFGFELEMLIEDEQGNLAHSQMRFGDGLIMVGTEWSDNHQSPASTGGKCTQTSHVYLKESVDTHCARAEAAGAKIIARPETQFYGDRTYRASDPEGHIWTFSEAVKKMTPAEWDKAMGLKTWVRGSQA